MTNEDLLFLAGWLEGEGSFGYRGKALRLSGSTTDLDVAEKIARILVVPVKGPYPQYLNGKRCKDRWDVGVYRAEVAASLMMLLLPHLGARRRLQIEKALADWRSRPNKGRGGKYR